MPILPAPPRVICTIGVHGSASTWLFNMAREMLGLAVGPENVLPFYADRVDQLPAGAEDKYLVIKSHAGSPALEDWLDEQGALRILSIRDPRDAMFSLIQRFRYELPAAINAVAGVCVRIQALVARGLPVYRYEDRFFEHAGTLDEIEALLGLTLAPGAKAALFARYEAGAVRDFAGNLTALPPDRRTLIGRSPMDLVTQIHAEHVGEGKSGKWRIMPGEVQSRAAARVAGFLAQFCYAPAEAVAEVAPPPAVDFAALFAALDRIKFLPERGRVLAAYNAAVEAAPDAAGLTALLEMLRDLFPAWRMVPVLGRLDAVLDRLKEASPAADILRLRLRLAMRDYPGFIGRYRALAAPLDPDILWGRRLQRAYALLARQPFPDFRGVKIFGIGLARSGLSSLNAALERLGYLAMHEFNAFSGEMLREEDANVFDAMTGAPVSTMFETLYHRFPNAKFICTTRPYAAWEQDFISHCQRRYGSNHLPDIRALPLLTRHYPHNLDLERVDGTLYFNHATPRDAWDAFDARIKRFFQGREERLLQLHLGCGREWETLCAFLGHDVPDEPYPCEIQSAG